MSSVGAEGRSFESITLEDLVRLREIANADREDFFRSHPVWAHLFKERVLCVALCQGAAKHYIDGRTGINDFDIYTFYKANPERQWYAKRIKSYDFGDPKFGRSVDKPTFKGRRVDCMGRAIDVREGENAVSALRRYLNEGATETARLLAAKAVILLEPWCGSIVWPTEHSA